MDAILTDGLYHRAVIQRIGNTGGALPPCPGAPVVDPNTPEAPVVDELVPEITNISDDEDC